MKRLTVVVLVALCACLTSAAAPAAETVAPVLLKVPVGFATDTPGLGTTIKWIEERLGVASNGILQIRLYEPGKLVAPFEILDAVSSGKVNAGYAAAAYWAGKLPAAPLFMSVPFGPEAGELLAWMWYGNGMKLYQEMYDSAGYKVKVQVCGIIAPETSGWFTKEIKGREDLQGLKMRFAGLGGQVMQKLGVSVSMLPAGEVFLALERKTIDATEVSTPAIDERMGFYKLAKYNYYPGWHQPATLLELLINKDTWNKMHASQQMLIDLTCRAATADSFAHGEAIQFDVMRRNVKEHGVINEYWSEEMLALFEKTWNEVAAEQAAKDPFFKKAWEDLKAFRAKYDIWQAYAFLPRPKPKRLK